MNKEQAQKGAKWWADQLRNGAKMDNGDSSPTGGMVAMMAFMLQEAEARGRDVAKVDEFEMELARRFEAIGDERLLVRCDYHPDRILREAAEAVGLDLGMCGLPWKTCMVFQAGGVQVACGYGAPMIDI